MEDRFTGMCRMFPGGKLLFQELSPVCTVSFMFSLNKEAWLLLMGRNGTCVVKLLYFEEME